MEGKQWVVFFSFFSGKHQQKKIIDIIKKKLMHSIQKTLDSR